MSTINNVGLKVATTAAVMFTIIGAGSSPVGASSDTVDALINAAQLTAYCNPGDRVSLFIARSRSTGNASAGELTLVGDLVDVP
jgi:hypothetical protein